MKKNTKSAAGREPSQRQLRVGESVRHAIAELLSRGDLIDPDLDGRIVTVTEVTISPDLRQATAYVMPLGGEDVEATIEALNRCRRFIRGRVAKALTTKFTPEITFSSDGSFDYSDKMRRLFETPDFHRPRPGEEDR
ncbi:Ribosome-binding factor A [hydrothermal vent metagenome]|uniref:Ribosome-binding factor A n=1 Tax=hydrothermal vent metagenome TaxID=652676 RepID=A0A3B0TM84_9ZZZZ